MKNILLYTKYYLTPWEMEIIKKKKQGYIWD